MTHDGGHNLDGWVNALDRIVTTLQPPHTRGTRRTDIPIGDNRQAWVWEADLRRLRVLIDNAPPGYMMKIELMEDDVTLRFWLERP